MQQGLHNEGFELSMVDGKRTYDMLFDLLDPKLVKFQFQMSTITAGFVGAEYFAKYPGRFISMHVQDVDMNAPVPPPPPRRSAAGRVGRGGTTPAGCGRDRAPSTGSRPSRRQRRRGQELLRRAELGAHAEERRVSQDPQGLIAQRTDQAIRRGRGGPVQPAASADLLHRHGAALRFGAGDDVLVLRDRDRRRQLPPGVLP